MYAVVVTVDITDSEAAQGHLEEDTIPMVKGAPGFAGGDWVLLDEGHGLSVVVFETEEQARAGAPQVGAKRPGVTFTSVKFCEVAGHA